MHSVAGGDEFNPVLSRERGNVRKVVLLLHRQGGDRGEALSAAAPDAASEPEMIAATSRRRANIGLLLAEESLQIGEAFDGDVIALGFHFPPDRRGAGDDFHLGGE